MFKYILYIFIYYILNIFILIYGIWYLIQHYNEIATQSCNVLYAHETDMKEKAERGKKLINEKEQSLAKAENHESADKHFPVLSETDYISTN